MVPNNNTLLHHFEDFKNSKLVGEGEKGKAGVNIIFFFKLPNHTTFKEHKLEEGEGLVLKRNVVSPLRLDC